MTIDYLRRYAPQAEPPPADVAAGYAGAADAVFGGRSISSGGGSCLVVEQEWPATMMHGPHRLGDVGSLKGGVFATLCNDPDLQYADLREAVFLDTETTGLNMGTGTYVFLVGAGFLDGDRFRLHQFFLRAPGEEEAFLAALHGFLGAFGVLVTFNGKAFDWPLIENRFLRHRSFRSSPLHDPPHLDLLHPARRLWKRRLESCRLASLESSILGLRRTGEDVPGWLIPSLYFQYLRTGNAQPLQGVLYHNMMDILSLAGICIHMHHAADNPAGGLVLHAEDFLCLARVFERAGDGETAATCYEEALARDAGGTCREESLMGLAGLHKRARHWDHAHAAWDSLIEIGGAGALFALVERAKYYEHTEKDYMSALEDVRQALSLGLISPGVLDEAARLELEHRQARLVDRVLRTQGWRQRGR